MKRLIILIAIFCSALAAKAQVGLGGGSTIVGRISGTVIDSVSKETMPYTTVALFRATGKSPLNGVLTDDKGVFKIDGVKPGSYRLEISFIGYPTKIVRNIETTLSKPDKAIGTVLVAPSAKSLKEVQVTGAKSLIENRIDKIVYNAEKDLTSAGGNATDVLQKVPLVAVDINGNVSMRGDGNVRVLINGKPSGATASNLSDVLKAIPADQIKSIEVITSPSAKYDAEGTAGIINIITKTSNISGFSGAISGGVGTRQNNGNASLNYNKNRFSLTANFGGNLTWPQTTLISSNQEFQLGTVHTLSSSDGSTVIKRHADVGNVTATYDINNYNNVSSTFKLTQTPFSSDATTNNLFTDITNNTNTAYTSMSNVATSINAFDWNIDYTHKSKKEGEEISFSTQWSHNSADINYSTLYTSRYNNQQSINNAKGNEYTLQLDYTDPISKDFKLEAGGKTIFRDIASNATTFTANNPGVYSLDALNSFLYDYNQNVYAGYGELTYALPKGYTVMAGLRAENTSISGQPVNAANPTLIPFTQNYTTFVPSFTIQKALTPSQTMKISYSKRISRPSLNYLNPYRNTANPTAQTQGDPTIGAEVVQALELNYNAFIGTAIVNASVFYRHTSGLIEGIANVITVPTATPGVTQPGTLTQYANIGQNNSWGASVFGSVNPIKIITLRGQATAYTYNPDPTGQFSADHTQSGTYIMYNAFGSASLTTKSGFITELFAIENSPRHTIQGVNPSFSLLGFGIRQQFWEKRASLGINVMQPFSEYKHFDSHITSQNFTTNSIVAFPFRSVGLTFSYAFGKLNFNAATDKKAIKNDDLKDGGDQSGMGGGGAPAGGGGRPSGK